MEHSKDPIPNWHRLKSNEAIETLRLLRPRRLVHFIFIILDNKASPVKRAEKSLGSANVFDRLSSVNGYTGTHKERFNSDGTGRGMACRDTKTKISLSSFANRGPADVRGVNLSRN